MSDQVRNKLMGGIHAAARQMHHKECATGAEVHAAIHGDMRVWGLWGGGGEPSLRALTTDQLGRLLDLYNSALGTRSAPRGRGPTYAATTSPTIVSPHQQVLLTDLFSELGYDGAHRADFCRHQIGFPWPQTGSQWASVFNGLLAMKRRR